MNVIMEVNERSEAYSMGFDLSFALKKYMVGKPLTWIPLAATSFAVASILVTNIPSS